MNKIQLTKDDILKILPHRDPILLADSAILEHGAAESSFYVDPEMDVFEGHFPDEPVLPGVYIIEAMAQCAGLLLLAAPEYAHFKPVLGSVRQIRFIRPVYPGDTLTCRAEIIQSESSESSAGSHSSADQKQPVCKQPLAANHSEVSELPKMFDLRVEASVSGRKSAQGIITLNLK